ncbi:disulfide bond formation protein B [Alteraurantiacibacter aestuarii]|uniref:Disulfide bond formation protein B n=1 Tax=Alteraurantiacibacter aestuarii TaxID=650004 RepID=A0A844ZMV1_9SPHN|nr:disulfide bond formation protein B [Alteraurantiacibacter aestuarii]MXO88642.1 disulfide bond formation protein B [Alteraurantiacibacter aestuarii]
MTRPDVMAQRLALLVPALLLGGAYISQYGFGLYPCEMCWWQRWPHFAALALALASFAIPPKRLFVALAAGGILVSGLIGVFHAGVEYGLWEGLTSCSLPPSASVDPLEAILAQPIIRCDQPAWTMMGISLAGFNAIFSIAGAVTIWSLLARKDKL